MGVMVIIEAQHLCMQMHGVEKYDSSLHIVSAQIGELALTLAQKTVESKSNEIPAVQELIKELEISGCMVVALN